MSSATRGGIAKPSSCAAATVSSILDLTRNRLPSRALRVLKREQSVRQRRSMVDNAVQMLWVFRYQYSLPSMSGIGSSNGSIQKSSEVVVVQDVRAVQGWTFFCSLRGRTITRVI